MTIGDLIRQHRESKGWTRKHLAKLCDLSVEQVKNIESGRVMPKANRLQAVADGLQLPAAKVAKALRLAL